MNNGLSIKTNAWFGKQKFRERVRSDLKSYRANTDMIYAERVRTMNVMLASVMAAIGALGLLGFFLPLYKEPQPFFLGAFGVSVLLLIATKLLRSNVAVLVEMYALEVIVLLMTTLIGNRMPPEAFDISFIVMICLVPLVIFDRIPRKAIISLLCLGGHVLMSLGHKEPRTLTISTIICLVIIAGSTIVSYSFQRAKLTCFDLLRESDYAKRHDFLTGLCNRFQLNDLINGIGEYEGKEATMAYVIDIDCYKGFNDTYGHIAGDECLEKIGAAMREYGAKNGLEFFRYGGEEILAVGFEKEDIDAAAARFADGILESVRALAIPYEAMPSGILTVSVGYTVENVGVGKMIDLADKAMYLAKAAGRNCVRKYPPEEE